MIKDKEITLKTRKKLEIYTKYKAGDGIGSHLVNEKKIKLYDYYKCDYCGEEIKIEKNRIEQSGGIIKIKGMTLALHNRCLKFYLKEEM